jgi:hypothetical protein
MGICSTAEVTLDLGRHVVIGRLNDQPMPLSSPPTVTLSTTPEEHGKKKSWFISTTYLV